MQGPPSGGFLCIVQRNKARRTGLLRLRRSQNAIALTQRVEMPRMSAKPDDKVIGTAADQPLA
jgi:hypothetical protein